MAPRSVVGIEPNEKQQELWVLMAKRDWKMKMAIKTTSTDQREDDDGGPPVQGADGQQPPAEGLVVGKESLISEAKKGPKPPPRQQPPSSVPDAKKILRTAPGWMRESWSFFKPNFRPETVALGPFHHSQIPLVENPFERNKLFAFNHYVQALATGDGGGGINRVNDPEQHLLTAVSDVVLDEKKEPKYYPKKYVNKLPGGTEAFVCMMLLDACFLLHFIECANTSKVYPNISDEQVPLVVRDILLLENQIPFAVLRALSWAIYGSEVAIRGQIVQFLYTRILFPCFFGLTGRPWMHDAESSRRLELPQRVWNDADHLLHLLQLFVLGEPKTDDPLQVLHNDDGHAPVHMFGSVEELKKAGVIFSSSGARHLNEITFKHKLFFSEIVIPPIIITETTICYILNLVAWEQHLHDPLQRTITAYMCFLTCIINHEEDVKELRRSCVLYHGLASDQAVADFFKHWPLDSTSHLPVHRAVSKYISEIRKDPWKSSTDEFAHTHFRRPWPAIFFAAAAIIFLLTLQTIYAIKQSSSPKSAPASPGFY